MNIFILCTGRCGSTTFIKACQHMSNYTAGHETRSRKFKEYRLNYPADHIEADNRLSWLLGRMHQRYGDNAFYVHLKRDRDQTAHSYAKRFYKPASIMDAFCSGIKKIPVAKLTERKRLNACYDYVDDVNANIALFLLDKTKTMTINLENISSDFNSFWQKIGAEGDLEKALSEFEHTHNAKPQRKLRFFYRMRLIIKGEWKHFRMWLSQ